MAAVPHHHSRDVDYGAHILRHRAVDLFGQWNANWQKIRQSFWNRGARGSLQGKLTRRWSIGYQGAPASIVQASAMAEIGSDMAPSMTGRARADFSVDLVLADPYFYGATNRTATLAYGVPQNVVANGEGVVGEGWPSAVNDFTVVLNGPLTTPKITNATEGLAVQYNGTIAGGKSVTLDILRVLGRDQRRRGRGRRGIPLRGQDVDGPDRRREPVQHAHPVQHGRVGHRDRRD